MFTRISILFITTSGTKAISELCYQVIYQCVQFLSFKTKKRIYMTMISM